MGLVTWLILTSFGFVSRVAIWADIATHEAREASRVTTNAKEAYIATLKTKTRESITGHVPWPIFAYSESKLTCYFVVVVLVLVLGVAKKF